MKRYVRIIAIWAAVVVLLAGLGFLANRARGGRAKLLCNKVDVQIKDKYEFVTEEDVKGFLDRRYGTCIGVRLDSLDLDRIERMLEEKSVVMKSEAWTTPDGILHVSIVQRAPALRFNRNGKGFYMDRTGFVFPLHKDYTADVPLIEGAIPVIEDGSNPEWAHGIIELMEYIRSSRQWKDRIAGVSVNAAGDIELRVNGGRERFIFGRPDGLESKFERMGKYFSHIRPSKDEGYYKSVNLKYNKQIICRKDT